MGCASRGGVRIVVLGARGSIGGAVVRRARLAGHQVRAVVRPSSGTGGFPTRTEGVQRDLPSKESVVEAAPRPQGGVHSPEAPYPEWPRPVPRVAGHTLPAARGPAGPL